MEFDTLDYNILSELKKNSNITLKELEAKLGANVSTLHNRIKKLERERIIEGYTAILNLVKLGFPLVAYVMISFDKANTSLNQTEVAKNLASQPRIEEIHLIAGEFDILLKLRAMNIDDLGSFVTRELREIQGIGGTRTLVSLNTVKEYDKGPYLIDSLV